MEKISIIIPVYNRENLIKKTVTSLFDQTLKEIEIICIDDGSTDGTLEVIKSLSEQDNRVLSFHKENGGAGSARNVGITHAKGEFLFFLDSDDSLADNDVLERLYEKAIETHSMVCGGNLLFRNEKGVSQAKESTMDSEGFVPFSDYQFDFYFSRFIYNRKFLADKNVAFPELSVFEDPVFFVEVMKYSGGFYYMDLDVYLYNKIGEEKSASEYSDRQNYDWITGIIRLLELSSQNNWARLHFEQYNRLEYSVCPRIKKAIPNVDDKIICRLIMANARINAELLKEYVAIERDYILPPLRQLIILSKRYNELRNRRFFRFLAFLKKPLKTTRSK